MIYLETEHAEQATRDALEEQLRTTLADVRAAVADWSAMRKAMQTDAQRLDDKEGAGLLEWLSGGMLTQLGHLVRYREALERQGRADPGPAAAPDGRAALAGLPAGACMLTEVQAKRLLATAGIPVTEEELATSADAAVAAAARLGGRVALKLMSPQLPHKTDAGAVLLNIEGEAAIRDGYARLTGPVAAALPGIDIHGVLVQRMAAPGIEMIAGVTVDPDFGPLVMVGAGGIFVEILKDVAVSPAPVDRAEALRMIGRLKSVALLEGARGRPRADIEALADLVVRLSDLALATADRVREIDVNPIFVRPDGVVAVDALARLAPAAAETPQPLAAAGE